MSGENKLGKFLNEVANWDWEEFCRAENDPSYTTNQAVIFALIRSCAMQKMDAIRMSLNRIDGKLKTPIKVEYPKIFYLFPNAKPDVLATTDGPPFAPGEPVVPLLKHPQPGPALSGEIIMPNDAPEPETELDDLPSLSLRDTLTKMSDYPRETPQFIIEFALQTEQWLNNQADRPDEIPKVKSVVVAHLLALASKRDMSAIGEVFDQIDGKLAETIQLLGDDIYITSYTSTAPPGSYLNKDGVVEIEATVAQDLWANKLGREAMT